MHSEIEMNSILLLSFDYSMIFIKYDVHLNMNFSHWNLCKAAAFLNYNSLEMKQKQIMQ